VSGPGGGETAAPGETNCTRCHSGSLITSGSNFNNIKLTGNFSAGGYLPDSTYTVTVSHTQSGINKWGFQTTFLDSNDRKAGTVASKGSRNRRRTKTVKKFLRDYIEHTSSGSSSTSTNKTEWTFEWTAPSTIIGDVSVYVVVNAANNNGQNSGDQIYSKKFTLSPSSLIPVASIAVNNKVACAGTSVKFTGSGTKTTTSYFWTFPGGSPSTSTKQNPEIVFNFKGNKKVTLQVENAKAKSKKAVFTMDILESPTAFISGGAKQLMCKGDSIQLSAQYNPKFSYKWSNGKTGNKIWVSDTGSYYVTVSLNTCSRLSNLVSVSHNKGVSVSLTSDAIKGEACENSTVNFTASSGFDSIYVYENFKYIQTLDTHLFSLMMSDTAKFNVKVRDGNGCISDFSDTVSIDVPKPYEAPTVSCSKVTTNSAEFKWLFNGHPKGYQISLDTGKTWTIASSGPTGLSHSMNGLKPDKSYTLLVRAIGEEPCVYGDRGAAVCRTIGCNTLTLTHDYKSAVCDGDSIKVDIHGLKGQRYSLSFDHNPSYQDTSFYFTPDFSRTYTIYVTDSNAPGCPPEELDMVVRVDKINYAVLHTQNPNHQFCHNNTIQFTATKGNDTYKFYVNNELKATKSDSFYFEKQYSNGDSAWVVTEKGVCTSTSEKIDILVFPVSDAGFTYSYLNGEVKFTPNVDIHQSYRWEFGDGTFSLAENGSHKYSESLEGDSVLVSLTIIDNNGCRNDSSYKVYIPFFSSVGDIDKNSNLQLFPNPAHNFVRLELNNGLLSGSTIKVYSSTGELSFEEVANSSKMGISTRQWKSGVYLIEVETEDKGTFRQRLIIQ
jgi:PKD repeat protein